MLHHSNDNAPKQQTLEKGVKVTPVAKTSGPPATAVHVEVDPRALAEKVGPDEIRSVTSRVPLTEGGEVHWKETSMQHLPRQQGEQVERFEATLYGPTDASTLGVDVAIQTDKATLVPHEEGARYAVTDGDRPRSAQAAEKPAAPKR